MRAAVRKLARRHGLIDPFAPACRVDKVAAIRYAWAAARGPLDEPWVRLAATVRKVVAAFEEFGRALAQAAESGRF